MTGHGAACQVVCKPETKGPSDVGLVEYFPDEPLPPDSVEGFPDVESDEEVVSALCPGVVRSLDDREGLFFSGAKRAKAALGGFEDIV